MAERSNHSAMWLPLAAGLVGAGLALLLAPRSGRETRQKIQQSADDLKRQASEGLSSARETVDHGLDHAKDMKDRLAQAITTTGNKTKEEINDMDDTATNRSRSSSVLTNWEEEV